MAYTYQYFDAVAVARNTLKLREVNMAAVMCQYPGLAQLTCKGGCDMKTGCARMRIAPPAIVTAPVAATVIDILTEAAAINNKEAKPTNPKDFEGLKKVPYHLFPMTAVAVGALQMLDGGGKYGRENYREKGVLASIYYDAAIRHLNDWFAGEDRQTDNGLRHLGGALASIAILIDAEVNGKLTDNRNYTNNYSKLAVELNEETVRITSKHSDKHPKHYTKLDVQSTEEAANGNK